jgi:hypothetical protein
MHASFSHTACRCPNDTLRDSVSHTICIGHTLCIASASKPHLELFYNMSSGFPTVSSLRGTYSWIIRVGALVLAEYELCYGCVAINPIYIYIYIYILQLFHLFVFIVIFHLFVVVLIELWYINAMLDARWCEQYNITWEGSVCELWYIMRQSLIQWLPYRGDASARVSC